MSPQLLAYIRALTTRDTKTLAQKALKTAEEVGELAKKVLPFENAHATTHRFVDRRDILEECADTMLCALSVAFDLGFSVEDLDDMMQQKAQKWARLQAREEGVRYPLPYELHVTVAQAANADAFRAHCTELGVKPIFLDLQNRASQSVLVDVMSSSVYFGDNQGALAELERISCGLGERGYEVVRRKIETVPWHPSAPSGADGVDTMPPGGYFECHLNVLVSPVDEDDRDQQLSALGRLAAEHEAHLSRNVFKRFGPNGFTVMMTLRRYEGQREAFEAQRDALAGALSSAGFTVAKLITEFSLFDSRTGHDASWLKAA